MLSFLKDWLTRYGVSEQALPFVSNAAAVLAIAVISVIGDLIAKKVILNILQVYVQRSRNKWDDILMERKVFERLSHLIPPVIIHIFAPTFPEFQDWIERLAFSYITLVSLFAFSALLDAVNDIYRDHPMAREKPIKGYLQVIKIFFYLMGLIVMIGIIIDRSPWILLSGIGAMTAVLLLVFKDSLLGLVASIQLAANNMIRIGDWIEMTDYGADGDVMDISLNTIKVQNWDKTITTIPTYALISGSFKNWRGMQDAGGRRIKRAVYIDTASIKFCSEEMLDRFEDMELITAYIRSKREEIKAYNQSHQVNPSSMVNGRRLTNIGTFRAYVDAYLKNHPGIHRHMTQMVRQLQPTENGLPIEVYAFTNNTAWVHYESIQADIFDHILAVIPQFDLRVFQNPSGHDLRETIDKLTDTK